MIPHQHTGLFGLTLTACLVTVAQAASDYRWPSPQYEALEGLLYEGRRRDGSNLASIQHPCKNRPGSKASIGAEWLRFAYHDVATRNIETGTGGLDASIWFELARGENFGNGMLLTIKDFETYPSKYISKADVIAAATTFAVASCGGPILHYRGGRVDAQFADEAGVPEAHQDLETHIEIFRRQGFSQEEMIGLVACGHTLGGVRSADFPAVVTPPENPDVSNFVMFDETTTFDNDVVVRYIDGTTKNPLVIHENKTMVSDQRIFHSDNDATMRKLASPTEFNSTCGILLEKMLNAVPANVTLTDEINLIPAKVTDAHLTVEKEDLVFKTTFRFAQQANMPNRNRVVKVIWCDRYGPNKDCGNGKAKTASVVSSPKIDDAEISPITFRKGLQFVNYEFTVPLVTEESISVFWFEVDEADGTKPKKYDNEGEGYVIAQDTIIYVPRLSSVEYSGVNRTTKAFHIVAAVKKDASPSRVYMSAFDAAISEFGPTLKEELDMELNNTLVPAASYNFYSANIVDIGTQLTVDLHAVVGDKVYTEDFMQTFFIAGRTPSVNPSNVTILNNISPPSGASDGSARSGISRDFTYIGGLLSLMAIFFA